MKGRTSFFQAPAGLAVVHPFDGDGETGVEPVAGAEQAGGDEVEQGPEFSEMVFDRGAGGDQPEPGRKMHGRLGAFGGRVLDRLGLVQDHGLPLHGGEQIRLLIEQPVTGDDQVKGAEIGQLAGPVAAAKGGQLEGGGKTARLDQPVAADRGGRHHQGRALVGAVEDHGQGLDGLAQTHVVGQTGPEFQVGQPGQPLKPLQLVVTQLRLESGGRLRRLGHARANLLQTPTPLGRGVKLADLVGEFLHGQGGQGMELQFLALAIRIGSQLVEPLAQFAGQDHELALTQGQKPLRCGCQQIE